MPRNYFLEGQIFYTVYSIASRTSFEVIEGILKEIGRVKYESGEIKVKGMKAEKFKDLSEDEKVEVIRTVPVVIVGNKADLEEKREVTKIEGLKMARKYKADFKEVSAKSKEQVDNILTEALRMWLSGEYQVEAKMEGIEWSKDNHKYMLEEEKKRVETVVLSLRRICNKPHLKIPKPIQEIILSLYFKD